MHKVSIIGYGNVGYHLIRAFQANNIQVTHILTRKDYSCENSSHGAKFTSSYYDLPKGQLVIICVQDDAIEDVLKNIDSSCPVAYTSGSTDIRSLTERENLGVFYPLQTFSKGLPLEMNNVPFFIEGTNEYFTSLLFDLALKISRSVTYANSEKRKELHLAAVFINNFTNHIVYLAKEHVDKSDLNFEYLKPLLSETVNKLMLESPYDTQTGPARRGDIRTIEQQLSKLDGKSKEVYKTITESILDTYKKK